jgi:hypothetical protein
MFHRIGLRSRVIADENRRQDRDKRDTCKARKQSIHKYLLRTKGQDLLIALEEQGSFQPTSYVPPRADFVQAKQRQQRLADWWVQQPLHREARVTPACWRRCRSAGTQALALRSSLTDQRSLGTALTRFIDPARVTRLELPVESGSFEAVLVFTPPVMKH